MAVHVVESWEPIKVENVTVHVFGDPGIGKGTLANMSDELLKLTFDEGEYRALGRQRLMRFDGWDDLAGVVDHPHFQAAKTVAVDTVGRLVEMAMAKVTRDPKCGSPGSPNQNGWPKVKGLFVGFFNTIRQARKDVVLISHAKIDRDDNNRKTATPDIPGGSAAEIYKVCDAMAYYSMDGGQRVLDFNVTETHLGKNPPNWRPFTVPEYYSAPRFLTEKVLGPLKAHLNTLSEEQTAVLKAVSEWGASIESLAGAEAFTAHVSKIEAEKLPAAKAQAKTLLWRRALAIGLEFDKAARAFRASAKAEPQQREIAVPPSPSGCPMDHEALRSKAKVGKPVVCGDCGVELPKSA